MKRESEDFSLDSKTIGALPILERFIKEMELKEHFDQRVPQTGSAQLTHTDVILVLLRSICLERRPFYALSEWASRYDFRCIGLSLEPKFLNDDRVGRAMDILFDSDRASLMTEIVLKVVKHFKVDLSQLHNDSTSVSFCGQYEAPRKRKGKQAIHITEGHSKDHRPDLKQLVFSLSVARDGAVPIHFKTYDGNRTDDTTHIETWESLRRIVGRSDFIYVADCKLCTSKQMSYITGEGGKFITVLPQTRSEDKWFKQWVLSHPIDWQELMRRKAYRKSPFSRLGLEFETEHVYWGFESPLPSKEGYRIVWILSSQKRDNDARLRQKRIEKTIIALDRLKKKIGPRSKLKTKDQISEAITAILSQFHTSELIRWSMISKDYESFRQKGKGRPGKDTEYVRSVKQTWSFEALPDSQTIQDEAALDGLFPLITNIPVQELSMKELLLKYKYQPYLEKRHEQFKNSLDVTPVFLKNPHRVEALMFVYFVAQMINALIERDIRAEMRIKKIEFLPLYPEARKCRQPATERVLEIFSGQRKNVLSHDGKMLKIFFDPLNSLQKQILKLLKIPTVAYNESNSI